MAGQMAGGSKCALDTSAKTLLPLTLNEVKRRASIRLTPFCKIQLAPSSSLLQYTKLPAYSYNGDIQVLTQLYR